ncbi:MAG: DUF1003 domain-containing protein [Alphaproteobacteria bacterium]|nr:DUF1003 domain-containing protein [Alphaproteobacteria bacterium]
MSHANAIPTAATPELTLQGLRRTRPARQRRLPEPGLGEKLADRVASKVGSWRFILLQSMAIGAWMIGNTLAGVAAWDPFPYILLNLMLSFQAAYTAPVIMMSQNRQAMVDRHNAHNDYQVNLKSELEIEELHEKIDLLREQEILELTRLVRALSEKLDARS